MKFENIKKEVESCKKLFGFELTERESGEIYYENIHVDYDKGTMSAFDTTINLDEDFNLDAHLCALYDAIVNGGIYE